MLRGHLLQRNFEYFDVPLIDCGCLHVLFDARFIDEQDVEDVEEELVYFVEEVRGDFRVVDELVENQRVHGVHVGQEVVDDVEQTCRRAYTFQSQGHELLECFAARVFNLLYNVRVECCFVLQVLFDD